MARALLIVERRGAPSIEASVVESLDRRLRPDHLETRTPLVGREDGITAAIFGPAGCTRMTGSSIALGEFFESADHWHLPGTRPPDGSYAILRCSDATVELVADAAASRTIWYAFSEDRLVASTSQRAIVAVLGRFDMNRRALLWMLSSGTLGPDGGWDVRVERVRPGERVSLDRQSWCLSKTAAPVPFIPAESLTDAEHLDRLERALHGACDGWSFDPEKWWLPLSGGVDSRGLLLLLRSRRGIRTVTWGRTESLSVQGSDAVVAAGLAAALGVDNRFYAMDLGGDSRDALFERFFIAGEGRASTISGYLDGFRLWKTLHDNGIDGVIRGDEAFGADRVRSADHVRDRIGLTLLSDYFSPAAIESFELTGQVLPAFVDRRREETLQTWRDRTYIEFRIPTLLAAMTDLKSPYVEVVNPLLARCVLECIGTLPDRLRSGKRLWKRLVEKIGPQFPVATDPAIVPLRQFVEDPAVVRLFSDEMASSSAEELFAAKLRMHIRAELKRTLDNQPRSAQTIDVSSRLRTKLCAWFGRIPKLPPTMLAFRAFIASRMNAILKDDAQSLRSQTMRRA